LLTEPHILSFVQKRNIRQLNILFGLLLFISLISAVLAVGRKWENRADRRTNETAYKRSV